MTADPNLIPASIELPVGLLTDMRWLRQVSATTTLHFVVPADYEAKMQEAFGQSEVVGIQRLLTLARLGAKFQIDWNEAVAKKATSSASIFPLLAVLLLLGNSSHCTVLGNGTKVTMPPEVVRRAILKHRLARDLFADSDIIVCGDDAAEALAPDLYNLQTLKLHPRDDFETLVVDALIAQVGDSSTSSEIYKSASALGVIVAELFENTDMHGKLDLAGKPLGADSLRGLIFKRIRVEVPVLRPAPGAVRTRLVECFEASVFDSGVGYFSSYTRSVLDDAVSLDDEWKVLHNCLERHYYPGLPDNRAGHRALGLYEVLRGIQALNGRIEIRTGRLFAYRTFLDGEIQAKMRPRAEFAHLAWPVPKLLDVEKKYRAIPSENEPLVGSSVRIIIPLK